MNTPELLKPDANRLAARELADRQLEADFARGIAGDSAAYRRFLDGLIVLLRGHFRRRASEAADVEDLVQETVIAVHERRHTFSATVPITAWIHAIARYKLMDWLRLHIAERDKRAEIDDEAPAAASDLAAWQIAFDLSGLLRALPGKQRNAIIHVRLRGLSVRETAGVLGVSEADVKISVHRGLKALAQIVARPAYAP